MTLSGALNALKSTSLISWKSSGRLQQTLGGYVEVTGKGLHSGKPSTVRLWPEYAGKGRYFNFQSKYSIPASIDFAQQDSPLCTTLSTDRFRVRTVEHLLSALEGTGLDNCRIEICNNVDSEVEDSTDVEVPILDGSASGWVEAIEQASLVVAVDQLGNSREHLSPFLNEPVCVQKNDSFLVAMPSPKVVITCGIDFSKVPAIGSQWFSLAPFEDSSYIKQIAPSRTFCVYEEVRSMRDMGLIKGGSLENALVCRCDASFIFEDVGSKKQMSLAYYAGPASLAVLIPKKNYKGASEGWLNPPLRFLDEPCRHKILDLVGDLSLFARLGHQGLPVAHIIAYKGGHSLHADFVRRLNESSV